MTHERGCAVARSLEERTVVKILPRAGLAPLREVVRRSDVRELGEQIGMGMQAVSGDLPIGEHREEVSDGVIGERPPVARVGCRAPGVIRQHVGQQRARGLRGSLRRVAAGVLQRVREEGNEPCVVGRLTRDIRGLSRPQRGTVPERPARLDPIEPNFPTYRRRFEPTT
jgi:hypothetical protein